PPGDRPDLPLPPRPRRPGPSGLRLGPRVWRVVRPCDTSHPASGRSGASRPGGHITIPAAFPAGPAPLSAAGPCIPEHGMAVALRVLRQHPPFGLPQEESMKRLWMLPIAALVLLAGCVDDEHTVVSPHD